jgi:hypothetical protein
MSPYPVPKAVTRMETVSQHQAATKITIRRIIVTTRKGLTHMAIVDIKMITSTIITRITLPLQATTIAIISQILTIIRIVLSIKLVTTLTMTRQ